MKHIYTAALATAIVLGAGMTAMAQGHSGGQHGQGHDHAGHMAKIDTNGDGTLSQSELAAAQAAKFTEIDANGDGSLSAAEMTAHHEAKRAERKTRRHARMMERIDTDGNGLISRAEFEAKPKHGMMRMDTNGDGAITPDEIEAMKAKRQERRGMRHGRHGQEDNAQ